jgi:hypothetical protein
MVRNKGLHTIISFFMTIVMVAAGLCQYQSVPLAASGAESGVQTATYAPGDEIVSERMENTKTYYLGENNYALDVSMGAIHYKDNYSDSQEQWKDIDLTFKDGQITKAPYILTVNQADMSITVQDKKSGQTTTLKLTKLGKEVVKAVGGKTAKLSEGKSNGIMWPPTWI